MSAGFTRGPWLWVNDDEIEQVEHPFTSVAEVVRIHRDADREQQNANARLIAAAPELYEALAEMVRDAERNQRPGGGDVVPAKAYLALAKARGGA